MPCVSQIGSACIGALPCIAVHHVSAGLCLSTGKEQGPSLAGANAEHAESVSRQLSSTILTQTWQCDGAVQRSAIEWAAMAASYLSTYLASVAIIQHICVSSDTWQHMCLMRKGHHAIVVQQAHSSADASTVPQVFVLHCLMLCVL